MREMIIAIFAAVAIAACAATVDAPAPQPQDASAACTARGGSYERVGRAGTLRCVMPYADAGQACTDGSQCDGKCVINPAEAEGQPGPFTGACQANDALFGCYAEVENGQVVRAICVD